MGITRTCIGMISSCSLTVEEHEQHGVGHFHLDIQLDQRSQPDLRKSTGFG